jgi:adenylate cyclase
MKLSIRVTILSLLTILILVSSGLILLVSYIAGRESVHNLVGQMMHSISGHAVEKSVAFLDAARTASRVTENLARSNIVRTNSPEEMERYFRILLTARPQFVMINYGDTAGNFLMVKRMPDGTFSTKTVQRYADRIQTLWKHENREWEKTYASNTTETYDPRTRPWYTEAVKQNQLVWTDVYVFWSDSKPGISCAAPIMSHESELQGVVSIDIGIEELSLFLGTLRVGKTGRAFILNPKHELIAIPGETEEDLKHLVEQREVEGEKQVRFLNAAYSPDKAIAASFDACRTAEDGTASLDRGEPVEFTFTHEGTTWLSRYTPFSRDNQWNWIIGVVVPEDDFMADIRWYRFVGLSISLGLILIAVLLGIILSRKISRPLVHLAGEMEKVQNFELVPSPPTHSSITEVENMANHFENMKTGLKSFQKYVPAELVRQLIHLGQEAELGGKNAQLTVLFSDIRGFTTISEKEDPNVLVAQLAEYLGALTTIIEKDFDGTVDKYIGDAIMAIWGAPIPFDDHAEKACRAALACQRKLAELNHKWKQEGRPEFITRVGVNSGPMMVGNIGSDVRLSYTVIGDAVNLGSRLEGINKEYGTTIIVGEGTWNIVQDRFEGRLLDYVAVKGKDHGVAIYELCDDTGYNTERIQARNRDFSAAVEQYRNRQFDDALATFEQIAQEFGDDPARLYVDRCQHFIAHPPPGDWDGVFVATTK